MKTKIHAFISLLILTSLLIPQVNPTISARSEVAAPADVYAISGQVTNSRGNPVEGVTIMAEAITGPAQKPPIVFVHGWHGTEFQSSYPFCTFSQVVPYEYFEGVDNYLRDAGFVVEYANLISSSCYTPQFSENVQYLKSAIVRAKEAAHDPSTKVILIAHSMGGLVSREYIESNGYGDDVSALFTFGSPHLGVPTDVWSVLLPRIGPLGLAVYCAIYQPALCQFSTSGMIVFNLQHLSRRAGVTYRTISGDAPFYTRNFLGQVTGALLPGPDDGIVQQSSGLGLWGVQEIWPTDENHNAFGNSIFDWSYFGERKSGSVYSHSHSFTECLENLIEDPSANCVAAFQSSQQKADVIPELPQHTELDFHNLTPGQTYTRTVALEGGPALFAATWMTGIVDFSLVDPNGLSIDAAYAAANTDIVTATIGELGATYYFTNTLTGSWGLVLSPLNVPAGGSASTNYVAFQSPLSLQTGTDQDWYSIGDTATITATLDGVYTSANITATLLLSDGVSQTLVLTPDGGGFAASFSVPDAPGYVEVRISAKGVADGGVDFERGSSLLFQISPATVVLAGIYTETVQPRFPGSNLYGGLDIDVGMTASISGTYGISADLVNINGDPIGHDSTTINLEAGTASISLHFDGDAIFAQGLNGPYTLTHLLLTDQTSLTLVVEEAQNAYTTAAYDYRQFGPGEQLYLPILTRLFSPLPLGEGAAAQLPDGVMSPFYTTTTDASGSYTFADLPAGSYRLTPSLSGNTFYPTIQYASVPPNSTDRNFIRNDIDGCFPPPPGMISWWAGDGNAVDIININNGSEQGYLTFGTGKVGLAFHLNGIDAGVVVPNSSNLNFGAGTDFSIDAWIKADPGVNNSWNGVQTIVDKRYAPITDGAVGYALYLRYGRLSFQLADNPLSSNNFSNYESSGPDLRDGQFHHIAVIVNRASAGLSSLFVDGQLVHAFDAHSEPGNLTNSNNFGIGIHATDFLSAYFSGEIDEVHLFSRTLLEQEVQQIFLSGVKGVCK